MLLDAFTWFMIVACTIEAVANRYWPAGLVALLLIVLMALRWYRNRQHLAY